MNSPNEPDGTLNGNGAPAAPDSRGIARRSLAKTCFLRRWRTVRQYVAGDIIAQHWHRCLRGGAENRDRRDGKLGRTYR